MGSNFLSSIFVVKQQHKQIIKEQLLRLCLTNAMFFFAFSGASSSQAKAGYFV